MFTNRETFNQFCASEYPGLLAYARLFLKGEDRAWAEDVVQDVFVSVWKRRVYLKTDTAKVQAYLLKSVYNRCMSYLQRAKVGERVHYDVLQSARQYYDINRNPVIRAVFDHELSNALEKAIAALPQRCQQVFRLSYIESLSHQEIADKLGISVRTVDAHIYTALKALLEALSDYMSINVQQ